MKVKTSEIKKRLESAAPEELALLISELKQDERKSVTSLAARYEKKYRDFCAEKERMYGMFSYERAQGTVKYICGIDEVGRGPFAGPVVAAAVILPEDCDILYLNDSKKLTAKKREELDLIIRQKAVAFGIGQIEPERIDEINILQATYEAMRQAIGNLSLKPDVLLNDAVTIPEVSIPQVPIIHGDAKSASIAAASIVAKVYRDRLMTEFDVIYPGYGFAENKGYGSPKHIEALRKLGPCPIHRKSFIHSYIS